jgi:Flp pilus assembly protein TadB
VKRRGPTAHERRLIAIHESDKSLTVLIGPLIGSVANFIAFLWCFGMVFAIAKGSTAAELQILLVIAAVPVLLFWLLGRVARRAAQCIKDERERASN